MTKILAFALLSACSNLNVTQLSPADPISRSSCNIQVLTSKADATKSGEIVELCMVSGTSLWSYDHTPTAVIERIKWKACDCGATAVYIESTTPGTVGTAAATLVGFKYKGK